MAVIQVSSGRCDSLAVLIIEDVEVHAVIQKGTTVAKILCPYDHTLAKTVDKTIDGRLQITLAVLFEEIRLQRSVAPIQIVRGQTHEPKRTGMVEPVKQLLRHREKCIGGILGPG